MSDMKQLGKYQIEEVIGRGGMGVVYRAYDPQIGRPVALKTIRPECFEDDEHRESFFHEARAAGALQHPNIVTIYDFCTDESQPYIVMEFIEGQDLDSIIRRGEHLSLEEKLNIMVQICRSLDAAHEKAIIHRDIKPANIRVMPNGRIKIVDFGIAQSQENIPLRNERVVGTVAYMSPEQLKNQPLTHKSDQFSVGVVFAQLLTGKHPFQAASMQEMITRIVSSDPVKFPQGAAPEALLDILLRMMEKTPEKRFSSLNDVGEQLAQIRSRLDTDARSQEALLFLQKKVDFIPLIDVQKLPFDTEVQLALDHQSENPSMTLVWASGIDERVLDHLERLNATRIVAVIQEPILNLRRLDRLVESDVKQVYVHKGGPVFLDDLHVLLTQTVKENTHLHRTEDGITRILRIPRVDALEEARIIFECVFDGRSLVESPTNFKVACLKLKGAQASGILVEDVREDTLGTISQILTDKSQEQVMVNLAKLSDAAIEAVKKFEGRFRQVSLRDSRDIMKRASTLGLPALKMSRPSDTSAYFRSKLQQALNTEPIKSQSIILQGPPGSRACDDLGVDSVHTVVNANYGRSDESLMYLKKDILSRRYVFLNSNDTEIQVELLRMLYQASQSPHTVVPIGPKTSYLELLSRYREYRSDKFFKQRPIEVVPCERGHLFTLMDGLLRSPDSLSPGVRAPSHGAAEKINGEDAYWASLRLYGEELIEALFSFLETTKGLYSRLCASLDLETPSLDDIVEKNMIQFFPGNLRLQTILKDERKRRELKMFLSVRTPKASRTELPTKANELLSTIKSLVLLIGGLHIPPKENKKIHARIKELNLKTRTFDEVVEEIDQHIEHIQTLLKSTLPQDRGEVPSRLKHCLSDLSYELNQVLLQYQFTTWCFPHDESAPNPDAMEYLPHERGLPQLPGPLHGLFESFREQVEAGL